MKGFHECEMKFYIRDEITNDILIDKLYHLGYMKQNDRLETDYIFDTSTEDLKEQKVLLRLRNLVIANIQNLIFTVKTKGASSKYQDCLEYETDFLHCNEDMVQTIIDIINENTGIILPKYIFNMRRVKDIIDSFNSVGFFVVNVVQKKRIEYIGENSKLLIDKFPKIDGFFIEIECDNENKLFKSLEELDLDMSLSDNRNYGQIISELTNNEKFLVFE